jgi:hypothetical protein
MPNKGALPVGNFGRLIKAGILRPSFDFGLFDRDDWSLLLSDERNGDLRGVGE